MTFEQAKAYGKQLEATLDAASARLRAFPRLENGLTPDSVKALPEWRRAKADTDTAFKALQVFNKLFVCTFSAEIKAERNARFRQS